MGLSDARMRSRATKLIYLNHRLPPSITGAAPARDRSNRWLAWTIQFSYKANLQNTDYSKALTLYRCCQHIHRRFACFR